MKIILYILLSVIALLILLILMIFFVPVKYRIKGSYAENVPDGFLKISWLCGFVTVLLSYEPGGKAVCCLKIAGIKVKDFLGGGKESLKAAEIKQNAGTE